MKNRNPKEMLLPPHQEMVVAYVALFGPFQFKEEEPIEEPEDITLHDPHSVHATDHQECLDLPMGVVTQRN